MHKGGVRDRRLAAFTHVERVDPTQVHKGRVRNLSTAGHVELLVRIVEDNMWGPAIRAGRAWHVMFTVFHGLEPKASFDEDGELLDGESTPEFGYR